MRCLEGECYRCRSTPHPPIFSFVENRSPFPLRGRLDINKAFVHNFKLSAAAQMSLPLEGKVPRNEADEVVGVRKSTLHHQ